MFIDTHAHINFKAFENDAQEVIERALANGVSMVLVGTQIDTSREAVKMAEQYKQFTIDNLSLTGQMSNVKCQMFAVVGLHPVHTYSQHLDEEETSFKSREEDFNTLEYESLAKSSTVVGIGECGLDYYRLPVNSNQQSAISPEKIKKLQKDAFTLQIKLAKKLNKALVIHCRPSVGTQDAYEDILAILDSELQISNNKFQITNSASEKLDMSTQHSALRFEIHSFTGSPEIAQEFLKRGAFVGLNGIITFGDRKNRNMPTSSDLSTKALATVEALAKGDGKTGNMKKVVETVPLDRIVLETDSPYLTPIPHRGKRNEPSFVKFVAEKVAEIKGVSLDEVETATTANARSLFLF